MTSDLPPALSFDALRAEAIPAAQRASGDIWTDYNIHDPGVTLLEQSCFALSEIAYRNDHPVRDLLTRPDGSFKAEDLALFGPQTVLPGRPVTALDMAAALSAEETIERVFVHKGATRGLFDISIVPRPESTDEDSLATVRAAFASIRMIGTDAQNVTVVKRHFLHLTGCISIGVFAKPEAVAAEVYHRINLALHGLMDDDINTGGGANRHDLFGDPAALWPTVSAEPGTPRRIDLTLASLQKIDGVESIRDLTLTSADTDENVPVNIPHGVVYEVALPSANDPVGLIILLSGNPVPLDTGAVSEEYDRVVAARIARQGNQLDPKDFDVLAPGRPRNIPLDIDADATLPAIYTYRGLEKAKPYRQIINTHLGAVTKPLAELPQHYATKRQVNWSDPVDIRRRIEMLDYLIALQGEEMPATSQSGINHYRTATDRAQWEVSWRETYLERLAQYNFFQGTANPEFGVLGRLAHLTDLSPGAFPTLPESSVALDSDAQLPDPNVERSTLLLPYRPTDMLLDRHAGAGELSDDALRKHSPWLAGMSTTPALYRRASNPDAYILARDRNSDWQLLFDPEEGANMLYVCASGRDRSDMVRLGNQLCNAWQTLNRSCETVTLIEDIHLRSAASDFRHASATALLTGWTSRTAQPSFRRYIEDMILRVAPAHVHIRPLWLSQEAVHVLNPLITAWRAGEEGAGGAARAGLSALFETAS